MGSESLERWLSAGGKVSRHWPFHTIESLLEHSKAIAVGVMYPGPNCEDGVPLIRITDVSNGKVTAKPDFLISKEVDEEYRRTRLLGNELLITLVGNPGDCALVTEEMAGWNVARAIAVVKLSDPALRKWLRYVLLSSPAQHLIATRLNTTVQKTLNLKDIRELAIPIPPSHERDKISEILSSLDEKIELNRQMNATIEAMAQALFKSWFVDFDPVIDNALAAGNPIPDELQARAKARQALGDKVKPLPEDIRRQFPDRFVLTEEMGWVPQGWGVGGLDGLIQLTGGGTPKTSVEEYWGGDIPWFSVVDAPDPSEMFVVKTEKYITGKGLESCSTQLLRKGTTILSARGTVGKCALVGQPMAMNQSCYGVNGKGGVADYYVYFTLRTRVSDLAQRGHGSVFNTITRDTFRSIMVCLSPVALTQQFDLLVSPYLERVLENNKQSDTLGNLRDILLPKLLSGELKVGETRSRLEAIS